MPPTPPPAPAERFARVIAGLCAAVAARIGGPAGPGLPGPLIVLIWTRLQRMAARVTRLAAHVQAGTLPPPRRRAVPRRTVSPPYTRLPRSFAWLVRHVPAAASGATQLQELLADPEMAALIEAAPQIGRVLRPLCRMLGVDPPPVLRRPPPAAAAVRPAPPQEPPRSRPSRPPRPAPRAAPARHAGAPPLPA